MSFFEPSTWRAATPEEVLAQYTLPTDRRFKKQKKVRQPRKGLRGILIFHSLLSPLDVFAYLNARFGEPNGMQSMMIHKLGMVREDSGNMINWDYDLQAGEHTLRITGAGREVHVMTDAAPSDQEWLQFAAALKSDFANYGKQKSAIIAKLEKWHVFPNRFKAIADRCADLQSELSDVVEQMEAGLPRRPRGTNKKATEDWGKRRSRLTNSLVAASVQLSVLTPIMFESFIGLITAILLKPEVIANRRLAEAFRRSPLDLKIYDLAIRCGGFARPIAESNPVMRRYWSVVNRRNDIIHGNVDPVRDALEIVYFRRKTPFFPKGGDAVEEFFENLKKQYAPDSVLQNYLLAHEMIIEIINHMQIPTRNSVVDLMNDMHPGWDAKRNRAGKLFPDFVGSFHLEGTRYDTDLIGGNS